MGYKYIGNCFLHDFSNSTSLYTSMLKQFCEQPLNLILPFLFWPWLLFTGSIQSCRERQYQVHLTTQPPRTQSCEFSMSYEMNCSRGWVDKGLSWEAIKQTWSGTLYSGNWVSILSLQWIFNWFAFPKGQCVKLWALSLILRIFFNTHLEKHRCLTHFVQLNGPLQFKLT